MGLRLPAVAALLFGSGLSALIYQTAWQRAFRLTFGASTAASAAVLGVFLGGLGVGGLWLGRRIERSPRPLLAYGNLELGIALLAALSPFLGDLVHRAYLGLGGVTSLGTFGAFAVRLLGAMVVMGPPALLMGGTLPAAARATVQNEDANRSGLALLYALNTTGAVVGSLVGPLFLFGILGTRLTLWTAVCINLLVALVARSWGRAAEPLPVQAEVVDSPAARGSGSTRWVYFVAAAVGFVFLALELIWYRTLAPLLGGSSVTFGLILATALAGIGFGGYLYSRRSAERAPTLALLGTTLALEGLLVIVPFWWGDDLALTVAHLRGLSNLGDGHLLGVWLWVTSVVVLPASVVSGYQFPLLFALLGQGKAKVAEQVGLAYAFNTLGTVVGSLLAGFVLLPSWGAVLSWRLCALALLALGLGSLGLDLWLARKWRGLSALSAAAAAGALCFAPGPGAAWRHLPIGAGRVEIAGKSFNEVKEARRRAQLDLLWEQDGLESTVAVQVVGGISFIVNGKSDGAVVGDKGTQAFLGLLPAALHGRVRDAFVVGLGTGMSAGLLGQVPSVERVTVAELEPVVVRVAEQAALANGNALGNPRVQVAFGDGRELLLTSRGEFDLIVSEPSNPYRIGIASLFTEEFYQAARSRLRRGGLFAQWVQGYEIDAKALALVIRTMRAVFPHVTLWGPQSADLILIGSTEPLVPDVANMRTLLATPVYRNWMPRAWGVEDVEGLLAHYLASSEELDGLARRFAGDVNRDDLNLLELAFARSLGESKYSAATELTTLLRNPGSLPRVRGEVDWQRVQQLYYRVDWPVHPGPRPEPRTLATMLGCEGRIDQVLASWPADAVPEDAVELWAVGAAHALAGDEAKALPLAASLRDRGFVAEALAIEARLRVAAHDYAGARELLARSFDEQRRVAIPLCDVSARTLRQAWRLVELDRAQAAPLFIALNRGPFAVYLNERQRLDLVIQLGAASGDAATCVEGLGIERDEPEWTLERLTLRAGCLRDAGDPAAERALADVIDFVDAEPATFANLALPALQPKAWAKVPTASPAPP